MKYLFFAPFWSCLALCINNNKSPTDNRHLAQRISRTFSGFSDNKINYYKIEMLFVNNWMYIFSCMKKGLFNVLNCLYTIYVYNNGAYISFIRIMYLFMRFFVHWNAYTNPTYAVLTYHQIFKMNPFLCVVAIIWRKHTQLWILNHLLRLNIKNKFNRLVLRFVLGIRKIRIQSKEIFKKKWNFQETFGLELSVDCFAFEKWFFRILFHINGFIIL